MPIAAIPQRVTGAFLAVEDRRFYQHGGIDFHRMLGALWRDLRTLSLREGSSTITMQLARNVFPQQIGPARTLRRKLWELVLAREIEQKLPKERILELYLNQIYLGNGLYGVEAAARGYFGKPVGELSAAQAAMLAALPKAPTTYDPRRYPDAARRRRDLVLRLMAGASVISPEELKKALRDKVRLSPPEETAGAPWFVAAVRRELHDRFGAEADTMGLRVRTGLDAGLQRAGERELLRQIAALENRSSIARPRPGASRARRSSRSSGQPRSIPASRSPRSSPPTTAITNPPTASRCQPDRSTCARRCACPPTARQSRSAPASACHE